jgi:hypothetical protein
VPVEFLDALFFGTLKFTFKILARHGGTSYNPSIGRLRQENQQFKVSMDYIVRLNQQFKVSMDYIVRLCRKKKKTQENKPQNKNLPTSSLIGWENFTSKC